ncbi:hypothetical protein CLF_100910 [Clonorchis sinensis]|uniref:Uncharacterized protein n=1 Tax=Clonorchis sinensis TaxID=79923 RepID=G7Y4I7_CLOSI|nr:hypothetical protein CLF_100910 [Clonorchis sinensis]
MANHIWVISSCDESTGHLTRNFQIESRFPNSQQVCAYFRKNAKLSSKYARLVNSPLKTRSLVRMVGYELYSQLKTVYRRVEVPTATISFTEDKQNSSMIAMSWRPLPNQLIDVRRVFVRYSDIKRSRISSIRLLNHLVTTQLRYLWSIRGFLYTVASNVHIVPNTAFIIIVNNITSVFDTDASLPCNQDLFESRIFKKESKWTRKGLSAGLLQSFRSAYASRHSVRRFGQRLTTITPLTSISSHILQRLQPGTVGITRSSCWKTSRTNSTQTLRNLSFIPLCQAKGSSTTTDHCVRRASHSTAASVRPTSVTKVNTYKSVFVRKARFLKIIPESPKPNGTLKLNQNRSREGAKYPGQSFSQFSNGRRVFRHATEARPAMMGVHQTPIRQSGSIPGDRFLLVETTGHIIRRRIRFLKTTSECQTLAGDHQLRQNRFRKATKFPEPKQPDVNLTFVEPISGDVNARVTGPTLEAKTLYEAISGWIVGRLSDVSNGGKTVDYLTANCRLFGLSWYQEDNCTPKLSQLAANGNLIPEARLADKASVHKNNTTLPDFQPGCSLIKRRSLLAFNALEQVVLLRLIPTTCGHLILIASEGDLTLWWTNFSCREIEKQQTPLSSGLSTGKSCYDFAQRLWRATCHWWSRIISLSSAFFRGSCAYGFYIGYDEISVFYPFIETHEHNLYDESITVFQLRTDYWVLKPTTLSAPKDLSDSPTIITSDGEKKHCIKGNIWFYQEGSCQRVHDDFLLGRYSLSSFSTIRNISSVFVDHRSAYHNMASERMLPKGKFNLVFSPSLVI